MKPPWHLNRRFLNDIDEAIAEEEAATAEAAEKDYERWLNRKPTSVEGYASGLDDPNRWNERDPDDRLEREGGRL